MLLTQCLIGHVNWSKTFKTMKRRNFIQGAISLGFMSITSNYTFSNKVSTNNLIKPERLKAGDQVAIVAPASNVQDPDEIQRAIEICNYFKLEPVVSNLLKSNEGYRTKPSKKRADELNHFFERKEIKGLFCIRGGYGSADILDLLDYELIRSNPKVFTGYSDITALHLAIQKYSGIITFHSPVLLSSFTEFTAKSFEKAIFQNEPIGDVTNPKRLSGIRNQFPIRTIVRGKAKGKLTGGNLSIISSLMGTPYEINTKDSILFLEDVSEEPYRIDRMLNQLRLAGKFEQAKGIVFGYCNDCTIKSLPPSWDLQLGDVLDKYFSELPIPSFYGLLIGHTSEQITLPYSLEAEIDTEAGLLSIGQSAVL